MRGRSLIKETPCQSLCTFCAHRLGQARRPSHIQQRFLQSSRSVLKPPPELASLRQDNDARTSQPDWGRSGSQIPGGLGSTTASWGRAGFGQANGPNTSVAPLRNRGPSSVDENDIRSSQQSGEAGQGRRDNDDDLLPHERLAREGIMREQAPPVFERHFGPGPESNRAGRYEPQRPRRSHFDRMALAKRAVERKKIMAIHHENRTHRENNLHGIGGFRIRKYESNHVIGDRDNSISQSTSGQNDGPLPKWGQLRRREKGQVDQEEKGSAIQRPSPDLEPPKARSIPAGGSGNGLYIRRLTSYHEKYADVLVPKSNEDTKFDEVEDQVTEPAPVLNEPKEKPQFARYVPLARASAVPREEPRYANPIVEEEAFYQQAEITDNRRETYQAPIEQKQVADYREEPSNISLPFREAKPKPSRVRLDSDEQASHDNAPRGRNKDKAKRRRMFDADDAGDDEHAAAIARAELKKQRKREKLAKKAAAPSPILLPEFISVSNLSVALKVKFEDFVEKMEELGFDEMSHDHILNAENAGLIAQEYNFEPIIDRSESEDIKARDPPEDTSKLPPRPPVVTIMGHVDHGKTTLLDWLRKSSVAATEHGGITQHIGAFSVPMPGGKLITFLDTPGHAAFLSMRQRGANVTDIVILVVAADDSVKPQTIEAINHAKAAKVPIIVAINKIDKEDSNIDRVKQDLARHGVHVEDFGGDTQVVCVSGKTGQGMEELEEAAVTLSEILDMRAEKHGQAEGWVLEASVKSVGKVATVLVRRGTMRPGDCIVAGQTWARIRCLRNEAGVEIDEAGPGMPVEIDGWREQPLAGDEVLQAHDEAKAKSVVEYRIESIERDKLAEDMEAINETRKTGQEKRDREKLMAAAEKAGETDVDLDLPVPEENGPKNVYFIVKGDVSGSVEAITESISALGTKEVQPYILRSGVGQLSEFDIEHAASANGHLISFNTPVEPHISRMAEMNKISILDHNIIYRLIDDVRAELSKQLPPLITQKVLGEAEIAQSFEITVKGRKQKSIAGCKVRNGTVSKTARIRVLRGGEKVYDGALVSLKNVKKDVPEMKKGTECGMEFEDWYEFQVGDHVQAYEQIEEKRYL